MCRVVCVYVLCPTRYCVVRACCELCLFLSCVRCLLDGLCLYVGVWVCVWVGRCVCVLCVCDGVCARVMVFVCMMVSVCAWRCGEHSCVLVSVRTLCWLV